MTTVRTIARSFAGGELSPELVGRMDLDKYQTGLALCKNFITLPHGPAQNRPGFAYVNQCKDSTRKVRLIPFSFSAEETMVLEFGHQYIRFHTNGGTLLENTIVAGDIVGNLVQVASHNFNVGEWVFMGGRFYRVSQIVDVTHFRVTGINGEAATPTGGGVRRVHEVATPYTEAMLFDIHYVQSSDVLTLVHPSLALRELRRFSAVLWGLSQVNFSPVLNAPTGVTVTPTIGTGTTAPREYEYVVTSVNATGVEESAASAMVTATGQNLSQMVNKNRVAWVAALGADRYNVYRKQSGVFGYVGQTSDLYFDDNNVIPDTLRTPPEGSKPFETANNYPSAVAYFDQRRVFAATNNNPQTLWMTKAGSETNLTTSLPVQDDDSISFKIAARQQNRIRHMVPLSDLLLLTAGGEWRVFTGSGEPVTPASVIARPQSYVGANNVQPVVTSMSAIYVSAQGSKFRELIYSAEGVGTYKSEDLSVLIPHLTNGYLITDLAFSRGPTPLAWAIRSDGTLLGLTYLPEQVVRGWHQHTTDGVFESVCCVAEGNEDVLYVVVRRTIQGVVRRYVERLNSQLFDTQADAFFVDSGLTYTGAANDTITGLWHLEGETVSVLGDGAVFPPKVVVGGSITLEEPVSKAQIGLPIISEMQTLPLSVEGLSTGGPSYVKNVSKVFLRTYRSGGIFVGPDAAQLTEHKQRTEESYGAAPSLVSGELEIPITPTWSKDGSVYIRQTAPLPLTIQSIALEVALGR